MAIEVIDEANPNALPSQIPCDALVLAQKVHSDPLDDAALEDVRAFRRAADYISGGKGGLGTIPTAAVLTHD
jgi:hypothetical protein